MTLDEFIEALEGLSPDLAIKFDRGISPGDFSSYRGYYHHLAIEAGEPTTVGAVLERAKACMGRCFEGYKGGSFEMGKGTPLWCSEYGIASGVRVVGIVAKNKRAIIKTQEDDE